MLKEIDKSLSNQRREHLRSALGALSGMLLLFPIPSSLAVDNSLGYKPAPYNTPKTPSTSASPFDNTPSEPLPTATPAPADCREGNPVWFDSPGMGIYHAPIEPVGVDNKGTPNNPNDDSIAAPEGRGQDGGYNTVGWYKDGSKPGAPEGVPAFLAHSTRIEKSLLPREAFTQTILGAVAANSAFTITIGMDYGGQCTYQVNPTDVHIVEDKHSNYAELFDGIVNGGDNNKIVFTTCAGKPNPKTGTSEDAILLVGNKVS